MYTTQQQVEAYIGQSLTQTQIQAFSLIAGALSKKVDSWLTVGWGCVEPSDKFYDGGYSEIQIEPTINITHIRNVAKDGTVAKTYTLNEDVVLQPVNKTVKTWLQFRGCTPHGIANIRVSGDASRGDVAPEDIQFLLTYMVAQVFGDAARGNLEEETIEGYRRKYSRIDWGQDETVQSALAEYRQVLIGDGNIGRYGNVIPTFFGG